MSTQGLAARMDALLEFLPFFGSANPDFGEVVTPAEVDGVMQLPYVRSSRRFDEFVQALYDSGWLVPFNWGAWQEEAQRYLAPEALASADVETLGKLLTLHVRKDRFCDGHLLEMAEVGHLLAILERMAVLRNEIDRRDGAV